MRPVGRYDFLFALIEARKPSVIFDIGVHDGKRSSKIIHCAKKHVPDLRYYGFDLWEEMDAEQFKTEKLYPKKIKTRVEAEDRVLSELPGAILIQGNTRETLADLSLPKADFIFVDGGHSLETISSDWRNCQRVSKADTVIVFDDYWHGRYEAGCAKLIDGLGPEYQVHLLGLDQFDEADIVVSLARVQLKKDPKNDPHPHIHR